MRITSHKRRSRRCPLILTISLGLASLTLPACQLLGHERVLYEHQGLQVGLQSDPSIARAARPTVNSHPVDVTTQDVITLLRAVRVSGWSGTVIGWFDRPHAIPLFEEADLRRIAQPIADAFKAAAPGQRVFFSLPDPRSAYGDSTSGSMFVRGVTLYVVVTDHKAFARADTAGGDEKDLRDTKGMRLSLAVPSRKPPLQGMDEPAWAPFETVHLSMDMKEVLAQESSNRSGARPAAQTPHDAAPAQPEPRAMEQTAESSQDLRLQLRELTQSNQDLRDRLTEQSQQLQDLKEELARMRRESEGTKSKKPAPRKPAAP